MRKQKIAFGPGASSLMLIAVVLALSVLTVLTMISARNDEALSIRSTETRLEVAGLFARGEQSLAKLDAVLAEAMKEHPETESYLAAVGESLPEGMQLKDDRVSWTEELDGRTLVCAVRLNAPGEETRYRWVSHRLGEADIWEEDFQGSVDEDGFGDEEAPEEASGPAETDGSDETGGEDDLFGEDEPE